MSEHTTGRGGRVGQILGHIPALAGRHWLFLLLFALGAALRAVVHLAYQPALFSFYDAFAYLDHVYGAPPDTQRPLGYPIGFMRPLLAAFGEVAAVPLAQHLLGLGMALAIYAMLVRRGVRRWLSALAAAPVLLDGYQLQIEQMVASDPLFQALIVGALALLAWRRIPSPVAVACAGLFIGAAATVRFVGLPLLVVPVLYVLAVNPGWRRVAVAGALVAPAVVPLLVYASWTYSHTGSFRPGDNQMSGRALHARVAPFADCGALAADAAPSYILRICPDAPRVERPQSPRYYMRQTLIRKRPDIGLPPGADVNTARREFARRVILNQPVDMTKAVLHDFFRGFAWKRTREPGEYPLEVWQFKSEVRPPETDHKWALLREYGEEPTVDPAVGSFLRDYQSIVYTRGPVFAAGLIIPLLAAAVGISRARRSDLVAPALLVAGTCAVLLLTAAAFTFSWRYQLPSIPLLSWSAALGLAALFPGALREHPGGPGRPGRERPEGAQE